MKASERDFDVRNFYFYNGPNLYLGCRSLVFHIYLDPEGPEVDFYKPAVYNAFPGIKHYNDTTVVDLFVHALMELLRMGRELFIKDYAITEEGEEYIVAVEFLDDLSAENAVRLLSDWFKFINKGREKSFALDEKIRLLHETFQTSIVSNPTVYALLEEAVKREIPAFYLQEEKQFQWGYGKNQLRGLGANFHTDSIKDTEFTMYKDRVTEFLIMCGYPTPMGTNCFTEEEAADEAKKLGFPVVVKPAAGTKGFGIQENIGSEPEVRKAFQTIISQAGQEGWPFEGVFVQQQILGQEFRLYLAAGKFAAAAKMPFDNNQSIAEKVHPLNIKMAESIAGFFNIKCLAVDVVTEDLSRPWSKGNFGIIGLHAGPAFFETKTQKPFFEKIAEKILFSHFGFGEHARIPIIAGNQITQNLAEKITAAAATHRNNLFFGSLTKEGVFFNGQFFQKNESHEQNVKIILRHPKTELALINHNRENIYQSGFSHDRADLVILENPNQPEEKLKEMILPGGWLILIQGGEIQLLVNRETQKTLSFEKETLKEEKLLEMLNPLIKELLDKYERTIP